MNFKIIIILLHTSKEVNKVHATFLLNIIANVFKKLAFVVLCHLVSAAVGFESSADELT